MATSNPICQRCGLEMEVAGIGWLAVYMAYDPPTPYEVRRGDLCGCPQCGATILAKFADGRPMGYFMGEPFDQELGTAVDTGKLVLVWEHYRDRAKIAEPEEPVYYLADWLKQRKETREKGRP